MTYWSRVRMISLGLGSLEETASCFSIALPRLGLHFGGFPIPVLVALARLQALRRPHDHLVDEAVGFRLLRGHEVVALRVLVDFLDRLAGVLRHDLIEPLADLDDLLGLDADVGGLALEPAARLVD